jgi:DNA invertase Pin-like site-specific DNA recombinase
LTSSSRTTRAVIYARISKDEDLERLGVQRQQADMRREAERRHARVAAVIEDNDLSGSGKVERPGFDRLVEMIEGHQVDIVLAVDLDRLSRGFEPYIRFYRACEQSPIKVAWLGGEADFATGTGLLELDIRASFAREELRKIQARTARKHLELFLEGKDVGGGRPFGYKPDRLTIKGVEARLIRQAAAKLLQGASLRSIARDWTERGVPTVGGKQTWNTSVVRKILISARISGRRERCTVDGKRRDMGVISDHQAEWPAIIDAETSDAIRSLLSDGTRRMNGHPTRYLLAGIAECGLCQKPLIARPRSDRVRSMVCAGDRGGCGRLRIVNDPLEDLINKTVLLAIDKGALAKAMHGKEDQQATTELMKTDRKLTELAADYANDRITRNQFESATGILKAKLSDLRKRVATARRTYGLEGLDDEGLRERWPRLEFHRRRTVIQALVEKVVIRPAIHGRSQFDSSRVDIRWRA